MKVSSDIFASSVIKKLRLKRNFSQAELSRRAGMQPAQLCKIERGRNGLTASTLRRLADALDVPVSMLLGENESACSACGVAGGTDAPAVRLTKGDFVPVFASAVLDEAVAAEVSKCERELLESECRLGVVPHTAVRLVYAYSVDERAAEILARDVRVSLGLGSQPCSDLVPVLENAGVRIVKLRGPVTARKLWLGFKTVTEWQAIRDKSHGNRGGTSCDSQRIPGITHSLRSPA